MQDWRFGLVVTRWSRLTKLLYVGPGSACTSKPSRYVTSHPGQLSLAIHPWVGVMSTSESWGVNGPTARYTSPVSVVWQCKLVFGCGNGDQRHPMGLVAREVLYSLLLQLQIIVNRKSHCHLFTSILRHHKVKCAQK